MKGENSIPAFELRNICIGDEFVDARPTQWDGKDYTGQGRDKDGNLILPTVYITVCPKCAQMIQFTVKDIIKEEDKERVICTNCRAGEKEIEMIKLSAVEQLKRAEGLKKEIENAYLDVPQKQKLEEAKEVPEIVEPPEPPEPEPKTIEPKIEGDDIDWFEDPIASGEMKVE